MKLKDLFGILCTESLIIRDRQYKELYRGRYDIRAISSILDPESNIFHIAPCDNRIDITIE